VRRVARVPLDEEARQYLCERQLHARKLLAEDRLRPTRFWKDMRETAVFRPVLTALEQMAGPRKRCMYCLDSHGSDVEHFWPKAIYPHRLCSWRNLLLCCTPCGRKKGDRLRLDARGLPLLLDPSADEPWEHLDFDPETGNLTPRLDAAGEPLPRGLETVEVLELDQREELALGYRRTYKRLKGELEAALSDGPLDSSALRKRLEEADEHGLLAWCLRYGGATLAPFATLRREHPSVWAELAAAA
jgi:uncharacterized protein (TIGR02646 family)